MIRFAQIWMPYGGAPADEIFLNFGLSKPQFTEELRRAINDTSCDEAVRNSLHSAYRLDGHDAPT
ncbi:hypothetical protein [Rhodococcus sp. NPDC057529]|uniref:hypothetical protein n=1 Tax=Rhodococcus sp. NPDC057529 TaxID=3346158 RepID=UPI00366A5792